MFDCVWVFCYSHYLLLLLFLYICNDCKDISTLTLFNCKEPKNAQLSHHKDHKGLGFCLESLRSFQLKNLPKSIMESLWKNSRRLCGTESLQQSTSAEVTEVRNRNHPSHPLRPLHQRIGRKKRWSKQRVIQSHTVGLDESTEFCS